MNAGVRESYCELFKKLNILPLYSQYILSLLLFVVQNIICSNPFQCYILLTQDSVQNYIYPQHICLRFKKECITQESKSSIVCLQG